MAENKPPIDESRLEYRYNEFGEIEAIDMWTGELVATENKQPVLQYSLTKCAMVVDMIRSGLTLKQIADHKHMPTLKTLYTWKANHPDFNQKINMARKDYADYLVEKAVMQAHRAIDIGMDRDELAASKYATETMLKIAEKYDPDMFGSRTKLVGDANAPIQFVISTGIARGEMEEKLADDSLSAEFTPLGDERSQCIEFEVPAGEGEAVPEVQEDTEETEETELDGDTTI